MVDFTLSESELNLVDGFKADFKVSIDAFPDKYDVIEDVERHIFVKDPLILSYLRANGMDTDEPVEIVRNQHRNRFNKIVSCYRFEGSERIDPEWITSGAASFDAVICADKGKWVGAEYMGIGAEIAQQRGSA